MVSTVHSRTHKVAGTSVKTNILLISMLMMCAGSNEMTERSKHISAKLREDSNVTKTSRNHYILKCLANALADSEDIVLWLIRLICYANTA